MKPDALIEFRRSADDLEFVGSGAWTAANAGRLDALIGGETPNGRGRTRVDMSAVREFDTYGAWLLERMLRDLETPDCLPPLGLPDRFRGLFEKVHETKRHAPMRRDRGEGSLRRMEAIGRSLEGAA